MKRTSLTLLQSNIFKNETLKIYNESGLSNTLSDTIVNEKKSVVIVIAKIFQMKLQVIVITLKMILVRVPIQYTNVPKINDRIVYINPELNTRRKVVIVSPAGKATGKKVI